MAVDHSMRITGPGADLGYLGAPSRRAPSRLGSFQGQLSIQPFSPTPRWQNWPTSNADISPSSAFGHLSTLRLLLSKEIPSQTALLDAYPSAKRFQHLERSCFGTLRTSKIPAATVACTVWEFTQTTVRKVEKSIQGPILESEP